MELQPSGRRGLPALLARVVDVRPGEGPALLWSSGYFFFLLASYYVIRPLREEMGVRGGQDALSWLFLGTLTGTLLLNPVFGALVSRLTRRAFIPLVYRFLILNLVVFWALLGFLPPGARLQTARVFFIWVSVFNLFAVSVFWGFMADVFRSEQGKRLFGFISVGGTLGAIAGAGVTTTLAPVLGPVNLILLAAALLEVAVFCVNRIVAVFHVDAPGAPDAPAADSAEEDEGVPPGTGIWSGIRLVATSPYLLGICLYLFLFTLSSTFVYFEQARIVRAAFSDSGQRTAFFARIDLYVNLVAIVTQTLVTGRLLSFLGVGGTLAALPLLSFTGFGGLASLPSTAMIMLVQVLRRAGEYAVFRPAREVLFTVVSREEKYSAKNLIDTFVYRSGDAVGALSEKLLGAFSIAGAGLAAAFVPVAALWAGLAVLLGRGHARRLAARKG